METVFICNIRDSRMNEKIYIFRKEEDARKEWLKAIEEMKLSEEENWKDSQSDDPTYDVPYGMIIRIDDNNNTHQCFCDLYDAFGTLQKEFVRMYYREVKLK